MESKFHTFAQPIQSIPLPERFTYPFHYTPHPLCVIAAEETQAYLKERTEWREELQTGKMFGVLVVRTPAGEVGYLAAFSGNLAGKNVHPFFVPPIYDLLQPDGFFRQEEERINEINARIRTLSSSRRRTVEVTKHDRILRFRITGRKRLDEKEERGARPTSAVPSHGRRDRTSY